MKIGSQNKYSWSSWRRVYIYIIWFIF